MGTVADARHIDVQDPDGERKTSLRVTYRYRVHDKPYRNDRRQFGPEVLTLTGGSIDPKYEPGASITVFYNPDDPSDSVLEAGLRPGALVGLVMGCILCLIGAAQLL